MKLMLLCLCLSAVSMRGSGSGAGFLHTQGQDMVNERGEKVLLRGVGLGNWMLPEGYMWHFGKVADRPRKIEKLVSDLIGPEKAAVFWAEFRQRYVTQADIRRIAELGFNAVRPALDFRLFLTEGDNPSSVEEGFGLLDNLVAWCREQGVYVIIDMHAAPGGQTGQNIDDSVDDQPALFTDKRNQDRLVDLWVKIAGRYKDEPAVAAYDLLNEPLPERTGAAAKYKSELEPLYRRITKAIRQIDKRHMITVEGADWANEWSVFSTRFDDNLFYQFHYYCWDRPTSLHSIDRFLASREKLQAPIWGGETGEKDDGIYWATTECFEHNNVGWSFWPWKKMDTRNTPYSIKMPENWQQIAAYSNGRAKPPGEIAQRAFDELLDNIQLQNCLYYPDVVNAIFRRAPGKVQAVNYGFEGQGKSYSLADCSHNSKFYRTSEPVPIELIEAGTGAGSSEQAIRLGRDEWTAYSVGSQKARSYNATVKAKAASLPAVFQISVNDSVQEVSLTTLGSNELKLKPFSFSQGTNRLKLSVKSGSVHFDWIDLEPAGPVNAAGL